MQTAALHQALATQKAVVIKAVQDLITGVLQVVVMGALEVARMATVQPQLIGRVATVEVMAQMDKPLMLRVVPGRV